MTFVSENSASGMRTWDADRGIELNVDKRMSDGTMFMRLMKGDANLHFSMQTTFDPAPEASEKAIIVRHVHYPSAPLAGFTIEETATIIQEALKSFKGLYGKFPDEHVRVVFK